MTIRTRDALIAVLIIAVIVALVSCQLRRHRTARNACEAECHEQGLDQWIYEPPKGSQTEGDCRCFSLDPV